MNNFNYSILFRETNSFGDLTIQVESSGEYRTLTFHEGSWPDALQLLNEIQWAFGKVVGK